MPVLWLQLPPVLPETNKGTGKKRTSEGRRRRRRREEGRREGGWEGGR